MQTRHHGVRPFAALLAGALTISVAWPVAAGAPEAVTIVSDSNAEIRERLTRDLARGVTVYRGYGGLSGTERDILYCVVTRLEIGRLKSIVRDVDSGAFMVYHALAGAEGGVVKPRGFH